MTAKARIVLGIAAAAIVRAQLSETDRARAAELWAEYGSALRDGAFLVATRKARAPAPPTADE